MKKMLSLMLLSVVTSLSYSDGIFHSTSKTTGAIIPIKAEATGTWKTTDDNVFNLLGSRKVSGGFGLVKGNLVIKSLIHRSKEVGFFTVMDCHSSGWVDICKSVDLNKTVQYDSIEMGSGESAKFEIETVFDDGTQSTTEHTFLTEE